MKIHLIAKGLDGRNDTGHKAASGDSLKMARQRAKSSAAEIS
ncbi:MAG: hypothetical protein QHH14_03800 [Clostridiales bacterium]|nr:hypothetical protein [Clostridiales bacterium]